MTKPHCPSCIHFMHSHDLRVICRRNGLPASSANADGCREFVRDPGSDDEPMVWFEGGWCVTSSTEGRGD